MDVEASGLDQTYWDYEAKGGKITLHREHYVGICVFPTHGTDADASSLELQEEAYRELSDSNA